MSKIVNFGSKKINKNFTAKAKARPRTKAPANFNPKDRDTSSENLTVYYRQATALHNNQSLNDIIETYLDDSQSLKILPEKQILPKMAQLVLVELPLSALKRNQNSTVLISTLVASFCRIIIPFLFLLLTQSPFLERDIL